MSVARPPTLMRPKREKGAERVVMLGVTRRMVVVEEGSLGMSLDVMVEVLVVAREADCYIPMALCSIDRSHAVSKNMDLLPQYMSTPVF